MVLVSIITIIITHDNKENLVHSHFTRVIIIMMLIWCSSSPRSLLLLLLLKCYSVLSRFFLVCRCREQVNIYELAGLFFFFSSSPLLFNLINIRLSRRKEESCKDHHGRAVSSSLSQFQLISFFLSSLRRMIIMWHELCQCSQIPETSQLNNINKKIFLSK